MPASAFGDRNRPMTDQQEARGQSGAVTGANLSLGDCARGVAASIQTRARMPSNSAVVNIAVTLRRPGSTLRLPT